MTIGILAYGSYIPRYRLNRTTVGQALGIKTIPGVRAVASFDEDTTTMAVEAARSALRTLNRMPRLNQLYFSTVEPAYRDKTNATAIHAALRLPPSVLAADFVGAARSGVASLSAALMAAPSQTALVLHSDMRCGPSGSTDELTGGDGASAIVIGSEDSDLPVLVEHLATAHMTAEFLDRWRVPTNSNSQVWEERFGETQYVPLAIEALTDALVQADLSRDDVDHLVVAGTHQRAVRSTIARSGVKKHATGGDITSAVGNLGCAHTGVALTEVLDRAEPGQVIITLTLADGASASVWRTTEALALHRGRSAPLMDQIRAGTKELPYTTFLTWKGRLERDSARRPDPAVAAAPPSMRHIDWKFGLVASRCLECRSRHMPPARTCWNCHAVDKMTSEPLADVGATVVTFTVDHLASSLNPPVCMATLDFDGGGRLTCELADVDPEDIAVGDRVEMTFRRLGTTDGIHNYFWKARSPLANSLVEES